MANLFSLPVELLLQIMDYVDAPFDVNALAQTCRRFNYIFNFKLYKPLVKNPSQYNIIQDAASKGNLQCVRRLLQEGIPVNSTKTPENHQILWIEHAAQVPICKAAEQGHVEMVRLLVEHGALSEIPAGQPPEPLFKKIVLMKSTEIAIEGGHVELFKFLLEQGALQYQTLGDLFTIAVESGQTNIVEYLHRSHPAFNFGGEDCRHFLFTATVKGDIHMITMLLAKGCSPYQPNRTQKSAFRVAAGTGNPIFSLFLADAVLPPYEEPMLCLEEAIKENAFSVVEYFVEHKGHFRIQDRSLIRMLGDIKPQSDEIARFMLESLASSHLDDIINHGGKRRRRHLFNAACIAGDSTLLGRLFQADEGEQRGTGVATKRFIFGKMTKACACRNNDTVRALLGFKRVRDDHARHFAMVTADSLITHAVRARAFTITNIILDREIYDFSDISGKRASATAVDILKSAIALNWYNLASAIMQDMHPASVYVQEGPFLQRAVIAGRRMLKLVIESGIVLNTDDRNHWTAFQMAVEHGNFEVVTEFLDAGFDLAEAWADMISFSPLVLTTLCLVEPTDAELEEAMDFYLHHGASTETRFRRGQTALLQLVDEAETTSDRDIVRTTTMAIKYLLRCGADPFVANSEGDNLIVKAARSPQPEFARAVINYFIEMDYDFGGFCESLKRAASLASIKTSRWLWRVYWDHVYRWDGNGKIICEEDTQNDELN